MSGLFGGNIDEITQEEGGTSPALVRHALQFLNDHALPGPRDLFTHNKKNDRVKELMELYENDPLENHFNNDRAKDAATLLLAFLCSSPTSLIPTRLYATCIKVACIKSAIERCYQMRIFLTFIPPARKEILNSLLLYLRKSCLSPDELALAFQEVFFRIPSKSNHHSKEIEVIKLLITQANFMTDRSILEPLQIDDDTPPIDDDFVLSVKTLYPYSSQQSNILSFEAGDVLYLKDIKLQELWLKAVHEHGSKIGAIPQPYIELIIVDKKDIPPDDGLPPPLPPRSIGQKEKENFLRPTKTIDHISSKWKDDQSLAPRMRMAPPAKNRMSETVRLPEKVQEESITQTQSRDNFFSLPIENEDNEDDLPPPPPPDENEESAEELPPPPITDDTLPPPPPDNDEEDKKRERKKKHREKTRSENRKSKASPIDKAKKSNHSEAKNESKRKNNDSSSEMKRSFSTKESFSEKDGVKKHSKTSETKYESKRTNSESSSEITRSFSVKDGSLEKEKSKSKGIEERSNTPTLTKSDSCFITEKTGAHIIASQKIEIPPPETNVTWMLSLSADKKLQAVEMLEKRTKVFREIVESEMMYVFQLKLLYVHFYQKLKTDSKGISNDEFLMLFSNIEFIISLHEKDISVRFQMMRNRWNNNEGMGKLFLEILPKLKLYYHYVNNHDNAVKTFEECKRKYKAFKKFIDEIDYSPQITGLCFESLLILPVQRMPRYVLLVDDLVHNTPEAHPDNVPLKEALEQLRGMTTQINERKDEIESLKELKELESKLDGYNEKVPFSRFDFNKVKRKVIDKCSALYKKEKTTLFLLTDLFIIAKPSNGGRYKFCTILPLNNVDAQVEANSFVLLLPTGDAVVLSLTPTETRQWKKHFITLGILTD